MNVSLSMIVSDSDSRYIKKALISAKRICKDYIIINQGGSSEIEKIVKSVKYDALIIPTTIKGNADPDREFAVTPVQTDYILMLDADEYLSPALKGFLLKDFNKLKDEFEVFFIPFKNLVDGVDIKDILGDDYHPRLYRRGAINWASQLHVHPKINTANCYYLKPEYCMMHERSSEQIIESHKRRASLRNQQSNQAEFNFLSQLSAKLGKDLVKPVFGEQKTFQSV